ncbi:Glutamine transport ATP-binding protein GlnQ [Halomonas chromatireducens]|uniref:Glutamine transport ATP-binding protein GlnQ n=1 Tax=Halomonas chromatireducens TaxID=507626 RepID=A0A0X8HD97_9GAMM|nr:ATP-binding cassette domain-containing protein [Halomonas chromatireducens]AMD00525.1 Glutamine transport ATP-binding protein GlnQ [Halomonas chromatireducens]
MSIIEFKNVSKHFGALKVLDEVDLTIDQGEVVVLIGPSGSGKSTLLRCINGLEMITGGDLLVDDISVLAGYAKLREIRQEAGMVFQQFNLFPQLTALDNVAFGPKHVRGQSTQAARTQALALLDKVGLKDRADHFPNELSGGQQQRVVEGGRRHDQQRQEQVGEEDHHVEAQAEGHQSLRTHLAMSPKPTLKIFITSDMKPMHSTSSRKA